MSTDLVSDGESETLYEGLVGALMGGIGGSVEAIDVYRDGRMKMAAEAIDRCCDAAEKTGVSSEETAIRAKEAENILALAGDEESSPTGSGTNWENTAETAAGGKKAPRRGAIHG